MRSDDKKGEKKQWKGQRQGQKEEQRKRIVHNQSKYLYPFLYEEKDMDIHGQMDNIVSIII